MSLLILLSSLFSAVLAYQPNPLCELTVTFPKVAETYHSASGGIGSDYYTRMITYEFEVNMHDHKVVDMDGSKLVVKKRIPESSRPRAEVLYAKHLNSFEQGRHVEGKAVFGDENGVKIDYLRSPDYWFQIITKTGRVACEYVSSDELSELFWFRSKDPEIDAQPFNRAELQRMNRYLIRKAPKAAMGVLSFFIPNTGLQSLNMANYLKRMVKFAKRFANDHLCHEGSDGSYSFPMKKMDLAQLVWFTQGNSCYEANVK